MISGKVLKVRARRSVAPGAAEEVVGGRQLRNREEVDSSNSCSFDMQDPVSLMRVGHTCVRGCDVFPRTWPRPRLRRRLCWWIQAWRPTSSGDSPDHSHPDQSNPRRQEESLMNPTSEMSRLIHLRQEREEAR